MGIPDLFKKANRDEVTGTKVLVASLDPKFCATLQKDKAAYAKHYSNTAERSFNGIGPLLEAAKGYDVVHLFCDVSPEGTVRATGGEKVIGAALVKTCSESGVMLVWIANAKVWFFAKFRWYKDDRAVYPWARWIGTK